MISPYDSSIKFKKSGKGGILQLKYIQIIGCLRYLANNYRLDIAYVVGRLGKYTNQLD